MLDSRRFAAHEVVVIDGLPLFPDTLRSPKIRDSAASRNPRAREDQHFLSSLEVRNKRRVRHSAHFTIQYSVFSVQYQAMPIPVITVAQMREWEKATWATGQTEAEVIRQVGQCVARKAASMSRPGDRLLILA